MIFSDWWLRHLLSNCPNTCVSMSLNFTDDQSTLVQVMAWCRQATSHCLSQCWPRFLLPYGVTRPERVNAELSVCTDGALMVSIQVSLAVPFLHSLRSGPQVLTSMCGWKVTGINIQTMVAGKTIPRNNFAVLILGLRPANERRRYFVTTPLIGWT